MNLFLQKTEIKESTTRVFLLNPKKTMLKGNGNKKWFNCENTSCFFFFFFSLENYYVSKDEASKGHLNVIKKSIFVKEDKTIIRPLEIVLVNCKGTEVKTFPLKIGDEQTPVHSIIEQNNFTNESLHVIGQQLDRIEEKIIEKAAF